MPRKITAIIASFVLVVALVFIWRTIRPSPPAIHQAPRIGAGEVLAEETVKAVRNQGRVVVVTVGEPTQKRAPADARLDAFRKELRKHSSISHSATEFVWPDARVNEALPGCSSGAFGELLQRHANATALVFLIGLPSWESVSAIIPQGRSPKFIVMDTPLDALKKSHYRGYFASGLLSALIVPRRENSSDHVTNPKTPREWFHNEYQIFTRENYESLPE
ncbi:MAG: hypothetical protein PCFJNLEI_00809 [Verrucomicrobiae bacterium]|nr:hypothetical protein [Verrucomicrobiae bacterium]